MSNLVLKQSFSFLSPQDWNWDVTGASANVITLSDSIHTQRFTGTFTYPSETTVAGTVSTTTYQEFGSTVFSVTGTSDSAEKLANFANNTGDTQATYAYVLRGKDTISGSNGNDILLGYNGNDSIDGAKGNDKLTGGLGLDLLIGGLGRDTLTGGLGADKFKFNTTSETGVTSNTRDSIVDFNQGQKDKIDLSGLDANSTSSGNNAFTALKVGGTFSGVFSSQGSLYFDKVAHVLYGNNDADTAADFSIQLSGVNGLTSSDLIL